MGQASSMWMRASVALVAAAAIFGPSGIATAQEKGQEKGAGFSDALISERVARAFSNDPVLKKMDISVETRDRVVHLTGFVESMAQINRAQALALRIEGVNTVRNAIRVSNRPSRA
jgi:hyperosmotically inducible periplasmic protein